eukprot:948476-Pleurochrysis_carterae.AAC.1
MGTIRQDRRLRPSRQTRGRASGAGNPGCPPCGFSPVRASQRQRQTHARPEAEHLAQQRHRGGERAKAASRRSPFYHSPEEGGGGADAHLRQRVRPRRDPA